MLPLVRLPLILASSSPRRRDLLAEAGFTFEIISPDGTEVESSALSIAELTTCNATRKALAVARRYRKAVVIGADTLVSLDGQAVTKPRDFADAVRILGRLNGKEHQVCTSVCLCSAIRGEMASFHVISNVQFHQLTDREIRNYLAKIDPLDKAGAYAAQRHGREIISAIRGSYTNVVGLPMDQTEGALAGFGITPKREGDSKSPAYSPPDLRRRTRSN